jgi:hypothetical protein
MVLLPGCRIHRLTQVRVHHLAHVRIRRLQLVQVHVGKPVVVLLHCDHGAIRQGRLPLHHVAEAVLHARGVLDLRVVRLEAVRHGVGQRVHELLLRVLVRRRPLLLELLHLHLVPVVLLVVQPAEHPIVQLQPHKKREISMNGMAAPEVNGMVRERTFWDPVLGGARSASARRYSCMIQSVLTPLGALPE